MLTNSHLNVRVNTKTHQPAKTQLASPTNLIVPSQVGQEFVVVLTHALAPNTNELRIAMIASDGSTVYDLNTTSGSIAIDFVVGKLGEELILISSPLKLRGAPSTVESSFDINASGAGPSDDTLLEEDLTRPTEIARIIFQ